MRTHKLLLDNVQRIEHVSKRGLDEKSCSLIDAQTLV